MYVSEKENFNIFASLILSRESKEVKALISNLL